MNFLGRLKFYGFGFGLGLLVVYALFGNRSCTSPNEIKIKELISQYTVLSSKAKCKLIYLKKSAKLLKLELRHFEVNYDLSTVRKKPCGEYFIQPKIDYASNYNYNLIIYDCDTISKINDINIISVNTCSCQ